MHARTREKHVTSHTVFPWKNRARSIYFRSTNCACTIRGQDLFYSASYTCSTDNL